MGDDEPPGDVGGARLAIGRDQIGDQFGVIFEHRSRTRRTGLAETIGLHGFSSELRARRRAVFLARSRRHAASLRPSRKNVARGSDMQPWLQNATFVFRIRRSFSPGAVSKPIDYGVALATSCRKGVNEAAMSGAMAQVGMTDRTVEGIREVLAGRSVRFRPLLFAGPAV